MQFSLDDPVTLDCEVYPNYFLVAFKRLSDGKIVTIETRGKNTHISIEDRKRLNSLMYKRTTFGFNSRNYDIPVIIAAEQSKTCNDIYRISEYIITGNSHGWQTLQKFSLHLPREWKHFDIQEPAPGVKVSLKLYGGRMHSKRLQDLPIEPGTMLTEAQMDDIKEYCINDLNTNIDLYNRIKPQMQLRVDMSEEYGMDLMSKSDAQIAEAVIKRELQKRNPRGRYKAPNMMTGVSFKYTAPAYIEFKSDVLRHTLELILGADFELNDKGSIELPKELKQMKIKIGNSVYQLGIGGLHSKEKSQTIIPNKNQVLADRDVASYYPSFQFYEKKNLSLCFCTPSTS
jgi:hypothetical protein